MDRADGGDCREKGYELLELHRSDLFLLSLPF